MRVKEEEWEGREREIDEWNVETILQCNFYDLWCECLAYNPYKLLLKNN